MTVLDNPDDGWCEVVTAFGERGLVPFNYLTQPPRKSETRAPFNLKEAWAQRDFQPSGAFQVPLERGEAVTLLENPGDGWCTIVTEKGTKGLVPANSLSKQAVFVQRTSGKKASTQRGSRSRSPSNALIEPPSCDNDDEANWDRLTLQVLDVAAREAVRVDAAIKIQTALRASLAKSIVLDKRKDMERGQLLSFLVGVSHNTEESRSLAGQVKTSHQQGREPIEGEGNDGREEDEQGLVVRFFCCTEPQLM